MIKHAKVLKDIQPENGLKILAKTIQRWYVEFAMYHCGRNASLTDSDHKIVIQNCPTSP